MDAPTPNFSLRRVARLSIATLAGFVGAMGAAFLAIVLFAQSRLNAGGGGAPLSLGCAAFFGGFLGAILLTARLTAHWVDPASGVGASGIQLILPTVAPIQTTEDLVRLVRAQPTSRLSPALIFVGSFAVFLLLGEKDASIEHLGILAGVLLLHEAGHAIGMLAFGYRDVRIFFIPFFGAATAGKPEGGAGWRQGVVLLLGPLPGILAGGCLALTSGSGSGTTVDYIARTLVILNAFNLFPIAPLDGGNLFNLLLFSRHRVLEVGSRVASVAALAWLGIRGDSHVLTLLAAFQLVEIFTGWVVSTAALALRRGGHPLPLRVENASEELIHEVNIRLLNSKWGRRSGAGRANWIKLVIERAIEAERAPTLAGSLGLFAAWVGGVVVALGALGALGALAAPTTSP